MFFTFGIRTYKYTNLFCSLQILSTLYVDWYHLHDCAMAHQRFIFQESECWCPLKEDVKVDDGFGKLAFWKPKIKLDTGSERAIRLHSHFLNILLWFSALHLQYFLRSSKYGFKKMIKYVRLLQSLPLIFV